MTGSRQAGLDSLEVRPGPSLPDVTASFCATQGLHVAAVVLHAVLFETLLEFRRLQALLYELVFQFQRALKLRQVAFEQFAYSKQC